MIEIGGLLDDSFIKTTTKPQLITLPGIWVKSGLFENSQGMSMVLSMPYGERQ